METLDPDKFVIAPHTAIVDEFVMTNGDGSFKANIDESFLNKLVAHMNDREARTGDLCPIVIGHTPDEPFPEANGPPLIGYLRNWHVAPFANTGKKAAFADYWVFKDEEERAKRFPRRSAEIYVNLYEIDPLSALGPTTPARDLGLLKLSVDGKGPKLTYTCPTDRTDPTTETEPMPLDDKADTKETGGFKALEAAVSKLTDMVSQLVAAQSAGPKPGEPSAAPGEPEAGMSDEEMEKYLAELEGGSGEGEPTDAKKNEKPEKAEQESPPVKMQRDAEVAELRTEIARSKVEKELAKLQRQGYTAADPDNAELVNDLIALPTEGGFRDRAIARLKLSRRDATAGGGLLNAALNDSTDGGTKRIRTVAERDQVTKLARKKGIDFDAAAEELGFTVSR